MLGNEAKMLWQRTMDATDIHPEVMNVSSPGNKFKAQFAPETAEAQGGLGTDGCCIATIIVTADGFWHSSPPERRAAINAMHQLDTANIDALYFSYTPSSGLAIPRNDALLALNSITSATGGSLAY
jgi:hypothetical protein